MNEQEFEHIMYKLEEIKYLINYTFDRQKILLPLGKAVLKQYELEANSGNELIFKEYSELKELVLKLNDMDKI